MAIFKMRIQEIHNDFFFFWRLEAHRAREKCQFGHTEGLEDIKEREAQ